MARRWYEITLDAYDYAGSYPVEAILDILAENPGEATYRARGILAHDQRIPQHYISTVRVKYNDLRPREDV